MNDFSNYLGQKISVKFPEKKINSEDYFKKFNALDHIRVELKTFIKHQNILIMIKNIFKDIFIEYRFKKKRFLNQNFFLDNERIIKDYYKNDLLQFDKHILDKMKKISIFLIKQLQDNYYVDIIILNIN